MNKRQSEKARIRRETFRERLVQEMFRQDSFEIELRDSDIAALTFTSVPTARRYMDFWKKRGVFKTSVSRHLHPAFGWCNKKTLSLEPVHRVVEVHRRHE